MINVLIIGYGNMGQAIGQALEKFPGCKVFAFDHHPKKIKSAKFAPLDDLQKFDLIFVVVKPQNVPALGEQIRGKINSKSILVSIAAGVPIAKLSQTFKHNKIVRVMPNLGMLVGQGIAAYKASSALTLAEKKLTKRILSLFTENFEVKDESLINAVTAISGSGPAYFFFLAGALTSAAKSLGLSPAQSRLLVEKTFNASASLQLGQDYEQLIAKVRSKKGTTDAALKVFQKKAMQKIIGEAVKAAYNRAKELSRG